ncbi:MAG: hypothetical protein V7K25_09940 [Nostoc sp.]|uniref:hypothetical protein n=1 Tax=Nostoc sp. TaxID=1180 RepID=UPI002FFA6461
MLLPVLRQPASYGGQSYTEADDPLASVFTDKTGTIFNKAGLGLYFTPSAFNLYRENLYQSE